MTDRETRYELQSEAPLVPAISPAEESTDRRSEATHPLRTRVGGLVRPLRTLARRGGR